MSPMAAASSPVTVRLASSAPLTDALGREQCGQLLGAWAAHAYEPLGALGDELGDRRVGDESAGPITSSDRR